LQDPRGNKQTWMFSRSNHHHQNEQRFTFGRRRPRSDSPPWTGQQDEPMAPVDLTLTKLSPRSGRTTKRGRATSSKQQPRPPTPPTPTLTLEGAEFEFDATAFFGSPRPVGRPATPAGVFDEPDNGASTISESCEASMERLEGLLSSALAMIPLLASTTTGFTEPIKDAIRVLTDLVQPGNTDVVPQDTAPPPATTTTEEPHTYAQAVMQSIPKPRRAHKNKARRTAAPSSRNTDDAPASLAVQLKAHTEGFLPQLCELLQRQDRPEPELDHPWAGVVVHNVPRDQLLSDLAEGRQYEEVGDSMGAEKSQVKDVRVLCRQEDYDSRATFSVRLMLTDEVLAQRAIRHGVFLYGTHCRVSRYRRRVVTSAGVPSVGRRS
jgi:hypothetical protein